jgi:hypothetical protein
MDTAHACHIEMDKGTHLRLFTETLSTVQECANACNALLQWLEVPQGFTVNLWMIDWPRQIAEDEWPSRASVNGGWAIPGSNQIFVYRMEEWQRVLLHETIHARKWDWHMPTQPSPCWGFSEQDTVYPHLFEAWTELYAEWLYCAYYNLSWATQRAWQDAQALQILARTGTKWTEDTNIFAYYVLKACLAPHIAFLWAFRNGHNDQERAYVLCTLVSPRLAELRAKAKHTKQRAISMRMTDCHTQSL